MKNWKTTVAGLIYLIGFAMRKTPSPTVQAWSEAVETVGVMMLALAAKDFNVTGFPTPPDATTTKPENKP